MSVHKRAGDEGKILPLSLRDKFAGSEDWYSNTEFPPLPPGEGWGEGISKLENKYRGRLCQIKIPTKPTKNGKKN